MGSKRECPGNGHSLPLSKAFHFRFAGSSTFPGVPYTRRSKTYLQAFMQRKFECPAFAICWPGVPTLFLTKVTERK